AQIRHVRGIKSVDAMYLKTKSGQAFSVGYVSYRNNSSYIKGALFFEQGTESGIQYTSMGAEAYYAKNLVHAGSVYYLNAIGGAHLSVDNPVNGTFNPELKIPTTFKMGVLFGVENEIFINDRFVLIINFSQRMLLGNEYGNYRWFAGAGIRYNF
ncbi:MAG: conjugal transfer protein TraO, partial [Flammeovirgaceae bacterium]